MKVLLAFLVAALCVLGTQAQGQWGQQYRPQYRPQRQAPMRPQMQRQQNWYPRPQNMGWLGGDYDGDGDFDGFDNDNGNAWAYMQMQQQPYYNPMPMRQWNPRVAMPAAMAMAAAGGDDFGDNLWSNSREMFGMGGPAALGMGMGGVGWSNSREFFDQ